MSYRFIKLFIFILLFSVPVFSQSQYKVLAVGFYNVENFFDTIHDPNKKDEDFTPGGTYHYSSEIYQQKLHNIATVLSQLGTEVTPDGVAMVGLAEIENDNVIKDLIAQPELKNRKLNYAWFYTSDERGISVALLYNPKYLKVLNAEPIRVPMESIGQKRPTRDVLHVFGVLAGDSVHILVNHWPSKSGGEAASAPGRKLAATVDKRIYDSLININPNSKIIIMGDFNDNPTSEGIKKVLGAKADKGDVELTDIYNPWMNIYDKGFGTENYQDEWNLIDQIMVSGAWLQNNNNKWKFYKEEIFNKEFLVNKIGQYKGLPHRSFAGTRWINGYSDHFPVVMYFVEKK